jgi:hypothetical protein
MASKFSINKLGFQFTVYGLCEYKLLPKGTPLVEMFYAGGILGKSSCEENKIIE